MTPTNGRTAVEHYAERVDAVLAQRTRLRGEQPPGDLWAGLPAQHPLLTFDPQQAREAGAESIASYITADDVLVDVGGGSGRISLSLAPLCREIINVEPSRTMGNSFLANASKAAISNVRLIQSDWLNADPPAGTIALVSHVTYLTREIVPFIEKLERSGQQRVLIVVNSPPPPSQHYALYQLVYGEPEERVPGHAELLNVLWELDILPDVQVTPVANLPPFPSREAAIESAVASVRGAQWSFWPFESALEQHVRSVIEEHFDEFCVAGPKGFTPHWAPPRHQVLITWQPTGGRL